MKKSVVFKGSNNVVIFKMLGVVIFFGGMREFFLGVNGKNFNLLKNKYEYFL